MFKKSKKFHNFLVTKATDLKSTFLKSPWKMGGKTCVWSWNFPKTKNFYFYFFRPFFLIFLTLPSTYTIKVSGPMTMQFIPIPLLQVLFPQASHRFRPPSLYRVKEKKRRNYLPQTIIFNEYHDWLIDGVNLWY